LTFPQAHFAMLIPVFNPQGHGAPVNLETVRNFAGRQSIQAHHDTLDAEDYSRRFVLLSHPSQSQQLFDCPLITFGKYWSHTCRVIIYFSAIMSNYLGAFK
jgi:hypothetical protein